MFLVAKSRTVLSFATLLIVTPREEKNRILPEATRANHGVFVTRAMCMADVQLDRRLFILVAVDGPLFRRSWTE